MIQKHTTELCSQRTNSTISLIDRRPGFGFEEFLFDIFARTKISFVVCSIAHHMPSKGQVIHRVTPSHKLQVLDLVGGSSGNKVWFSDDTERTGLRRVVLRSLLHNCLIGQWVIGGDNS